MRDFFVYGIFVVGDDGVTPTFDRLASSLEEARKLVSQWGHDLCGEEPVRDDTYLYEDELKECEIRIVQLYWNSPERVPLEQYSVDLED